MLEVVGTHGHVQAVVWGSSTSAEELVLVCLLEWCLFAYWSSCVCTRSQSCACDPGCTSGKRWWIPHTTTRPETLQGVVGEGKPIAKLVNHVWRVLVPSGPVPCGG